MPGKKRNIQNRIDKQGQKIFENALPDKKEFSMVYSKENGEDFGIDGQIQIFENEKHTGEFLKVQLKSKGRAKYIEDGTYLSLPLDLDSSYFLIDEVQDPTVLIVVDNEESKVFYHPIQIDPISRSALDDKLVNADSKAKNPQITIRIDTKNILSPNNYQGLYEYLQKAKIKLSQRNILRIKTNSTLSEGLRHVEEIEREILNLAGFDWVTRKSESFTPGTMLTMTDSTGKVIDYIPNSSYTEDHAPIIKFKTKFSTKSANEQKKYEQFKKLVQEGKGSIQLDKSNIEFFEVSSGENILDSIVNHENMSIRIEPSINKVRNTVFLGNGTDEIRIEVDVWIQDNHFFIESIEGQLLEVKIKYAIGNPAGTFNINTSSYKFVSPTQELQILRFIGSLSQQLKVSFIDPSGFKRKLLEADLGDKKILNDKRLEFIKALSEIESITGVPIDYPLPADMEENDIRNVFWLHQLVAKGKVVENLTVNFVLEKDPSEELKSGMAMQFTMNPPEVYLFGKPYVLNDFIQNVRGVITEITQKKEETKVRYLVKINKAENTFHKKIHS